MQFIQSNYNMYFELNNKYYIYSTLTKGLSELTPKVYYQLKNNKTEVLDINIKENLISEKYLIQENYEKELFIKEMNKAKYSSNTLSLVIAPTLNCNFACPYCYEERQNKIMSDETINKIIDFVKTKHKENNLKYLSITWYGGEPTLAMNQIKYMSQKLIAFCEKYNIEYIANMITNGFLLNDKNLTILEELKVMDFQVTIDGPPRIHDARRKLLNDGATFDTIIKHVKNINDNYLDMKVSLRINIDKTNESYLEELINIFIENKLFNVYISLGHVQSFTEACKSVESTCLDKDSFLLKLNDFALLLKDLEFGNYMDMLEIPGKVIYCGALIELSYVVDPDGYFYKCWNDVGVPEEAIFNIHKPQTDKQILNETKYLNYNPLNYIKCESCKGLPICLGGCPYISLKEDESKCYNYEIEIKNYINEYLKGVK